MTARLHIVFACLFIMLMAVPFASARAHQCSTGAVGCETRLRLAQAEFFGPVEDPNKARELREGLAPMPHPTVPENGPAGPGGDGLEACLMKVGKRSDVAPMPWRGDVGRRPYSWASLLGITPAHAIGNAPGEIAAYAVGVLGPACVRRRNTADWQKLSKGGPVEVGDTVATGMTGRVRLQFTDRDDARDSGPSVMNLAPSTEVLIETFAVKLHKKPTGLWDLISGRIRVFLKGWGTSSGVNVRAGVAICGMRGTDFILAYDPPRQQVDLQVHEGKVEFSTPKASRMVQTGQQIAATGDTMGDASRLFQDAWEQDVAAIDQGLPEASPILPAAPPPAAPAAPAESVERAPDSNAVPIPDLPPDHPLNELLRNLPRQPDQKEARSTPAPEGPSPNAQSKSAHGWLGVRIQKINADIALALGLAKAEGALVSEVIAGGPAVGKLEPGDAILEVGGESVRDSADVARRVAGHAPGEAVRFKFLRDGTALNAVIVLGSWPHSP